MCCNLSNFETSTAVTNSFVQLLTGISIPKTHVGTVKINTSLTLHDVLCIPDFKFNLISVSKLAETQGCSCIFTSSNCFLQDHIQKTTIGMGRRAGDLYILDTTSYTYNPQSISNVSNSNVSNVVSFDVVKNNIWHYRLWHPSSAKIKCISGLDSSIKHSDNHDTSCIICPLAK